MRPLIQIVAFIGRLFAGDAGRDWLRRKYIERYGTTPSVTDL
jgi:hypothetical protein